MRKIYSRTRSVTPLDTDSSSASVYFRAWRNFFLEVAELTRFSNRFFTQVFRRPFELQELVKQCYNIGYKTLPLVGITGFIMGLVLTIQSRPTLVEFGAESWLPAMVAISIIREIGPVLTALITAGKVGSGIGAELASMKVTEQIDAMEVSGINPFKYLVATRVLATTLMVPLLTVFSDAIGLFGAYVAVNLKSDVSLYLFISQAFAAVEFIDLFPALIKTFFFGYAVGLIGCFKGYYSERGTEGVGASANSAVVISSLLIFIIDMIAVQITSIFIK